MEIRREKSFTRGESKIPENENHVFRTIVPSSRFDRLRFKLTIGNNDWLKYSKDLKVNHVDLPSTLHDKVE